MSILPSNLTSLVAHFDAFSVEVNTLTRFAKMGDAAETVGRERCDGIDGSPAFDETSTKGWNKTRKGSVEYDPSVSDTRCF